MYMIIDDVTQVYTFTTQCDEFDELTDIDYVI